MEQKTIKVFAVGAAGGLLGAFLVVGGVSVMNGNFNPFGSNTSVVDPGNNKISKQTYKNSTDVTKAVAKVQPAVVSIVNLQTPNNGGGDMWSKFFGQNENSDSTPSSGEPQPAAEGSGFIYKKSGNEAYIVTNAHVVEGQQGLEVILSDGTKLTGTLVGSDTYSDLAVIKVDSSKVANINPLQFADSSKLTVGEVAIAMGSPLGTKYSNTATQGIISATSRRVFNVNQNGEPVDTPAIQTDAAVNSGNSGGPLVNVEGQVTGVTSSKISGSASSGEGASVEGMGFAIKSNDVVSVINKLEKNGKIVYPALGVSGLREVSSLTNQQVTKGLGLDPNKVKGGLVIGSVATASPADKGGLKKFDVIVAIDGKEVTDYPSVLAELYKHDVGDTIKLTFWRKKEEKTVDIKLTMKKEPTEKTNKSN